MAPLRVGNEATENFMDRKFAKTFTSPRILKFVVRPDQVYFPFFTFKIMKIVGICEKELLKLLILEFVPSGGFFVPPHSLTLCIRGFVHQ
jgi:hypothetical protein